MLQTMQRERTDIKPTRQEIYRHFELGDHVPVYRTLLADLETPVSVILKLKEAGNRLFCWKASRAASRWGAIRSSASIQRPAQRQGQCRQLRARRRDNEIRRPRRARSAACDQRHFQTVNPVALEGLPRLVGGAVGYMSYDIVRYFEELPATASDDLRVPTVAFMLPDTLVIFDHAMLSSSSWPTPIIQATIRMPPMNGRSPALRELPRLCRRP